MLRDDEAITRFAAEHPAADATALASLVRDARVERSRGGPPHRYRELFRRIRQAAG
jgi:ribosome-associated protein